MRKVILLLLITAFMVSTISVYSQEPSPPTAKGQPGELNTKTNARSDIKTKADNGIPQQSVPVINQTNPAPRNQTAKDAHKQDGNIGTDCTGREDPIVKYTLWNVIFTGLLFICNIALWFSTRKAADAAKRSAEALPTIERAYVFVDDCTPEHVNANMFKVVVSFSNFGKTPAILTKFHGEFVWGEQPPSKSPETELPFPEGGVVVKSNSSEVIEVSSYVPPEILGKIERKEIKSFCCGIIEYRDIWKVQHETGFCWEVNPAGPRGRLYDSPLNYYT